MLEDNDVLNFFNGIFSNQKIYSENYDSGRQPTIAVRLRGDLELDIDGDIFILKEGSIIKGSPDSLKKIGLRIK